MAMAESRRIYVRTDPDDCLKVTVTDQDGTPIDGIRSIAWRATADHIPTAVIEADLLDLDVAGHERPSLADMKLDEIRAHLNHRIAAEREAARVFEGQPAVETSRGALMAYEALRKRFFDPEGP